ncbi:hypothetical protein NitYY0826_C0060 [Nitratiruptor sp. YY08-26]|nr:hypothetical protein NitYY0813_C0060 [Nitratiruptor sp. YY08-13]BCD65160.1 hypothetical protein NitYY0826_C0060 [Nitratiruptor sp. YY08-26]
MTKRASTETYPHRSKRNIKSALSRIAFASTLSDEIGQLEAILYPYTD